MLKRIIFLITAILFVSSIIFSPTLAKADYFIKTIKHSDAVVMMGQSQPARDEEGAVWIAKNKMRQDEGKNKTTIIRFDLKKIYVLDHSKKTYSEIDLPIDLKKIIPPQAQQLMQTLQVSSSFTDTGETKTIRDWKCKKYLVEISINMMGMDMPIKLEIWASKDLRIDLNMYQKLYGEILSLNPMFKNLSEEIKKVEGYPVLTIFSLNMMGTEQKYTEEVMSVEKIKAPAGTYDLPQGYTITAFNPLELGK